MAHNIDLSTGGPAMAYVGEVPWHGLGEKLPIGAPIEKWIEAARLDWQIFRQPVRYLFQGIIREVPDRHVLVRSDSGAALSVVSDSYCIVQPREVIEFYKDLVEGSRFSLETAGALDEGRKVWGLARSNSSYNISKEDQIDAFLLLASSCDKSLATTVAFTSIRVVCNNTLNFAMEKIQGKRVMSYKIPHNTQFDWAKAKSKLSLVDNAWTTFSQTAGALSNIKVNKDAINKYFTALFLPGKDKNERLSNHALIEIQHLKSAFADGEGQQLASAKDTAWGLVNAVTFYVDHQRKSKNQGERLDSAWFGTGAAIKVKAWETAAKMFLSGDSSDAA